MTRNSIALLLLAATLWAEERMTLTFSSALPEGFQT